MSILEKIYKAGLKFSEPLTAEETYRAIVNEAAKLVNGEHGSIHLAENGELKRVYASNPLFYKIKFRNNGIRYQVFKKRIAVVLHTKKVKQLEKQHVALTKLSGRSIILIPLSYQNKSTGLLSVISFENRNFSEKELEILKLFGAMASVAVRKAQLYTQTKEALDTRDLFISLAAHELRTPLTTINGYIQLLFSKLREGKTIQNKWILELSFESKRLQSLIDEFLEINRIRTGKLQYDWQEINIRTLTKRVIDNFRFNNPARKLTYKDNLNPKDYIIIGDLNKLIQVLTNILENAKKYSPDNKKISLTLKNQPQHFVFEVKDEGQGIEENDLPRIFRDFYKGKNSQHEGMGLGLYLAKNIIDSHHGEIEIKSKVGRGTTVKIKLPKLEE